MAVDCVIRASSDPPKEDEPISSKDVSAGAGGSSLFRDQNGILGWLVN